jgi:hypothetical protein
MDLIRFSMTREVRDETRRMSLDVGTGEKTHAPASANAIRQCSGNLADSAPLLELDEEDGEAELTLATSTPGSEYWLP